MTLNPLIIYICSVNIVCADSTAILFHSAITLTVWQAPSCCEFNTFNIKLSVITICRLVIVEHSGLRNLLNTVCAIDRPRLWKHCYHSCVFLVVVVSIGDLPSSAHICLFVLCSDLSPKLILKPLFNSDQLPLNARCLFIVRANVSNLSQIYVRFVADRWHSLGWRTPSISLFS